MRRKLDQRTLIFLGVLLFISVVRPLMSGGVSYLVDSFIDTLYMLPAIIIAISFHEFAHAKVADYWGDDTPAREGRLTVDPRAHVDLAGIICLIFIHFGWGKPVRINPQRFRDRRKGLITVSLAGVTMNLILAFVFGGILKMLITFAPAFIGSKIGSIFASMILEVIYVNVSLMLFNLLPVPPLDGFNFLSELFKLYYTRFYAFVRNNSMWILMIMIFFNIPSMLLSGPMAAIVHFILSTVYGIY